MKGLRGVVIIDEIQREPELLDILRVLADRRPLPARSLILGSASPSLMRGGAESLAGRVSYHELQGFSLDEVGATHADRLWLRRGFPRSYLAGSSAASKEWRRAFTGAFLERDVPQLGVNIRATTLRRFWMMLAHCHGQTWNSSECARSFGVAETTVRNYLHLLANALVVRQLPSWHENIGKRQVKAPKVSLSDSGIRHALLNINSKEDLEGHPKVGASWEGFAIGEVVRHLSARPEEGYFWATHAGAELDLLVVRGNNRIGVEIKRTVSPSITPSMRSALPDLRLQRLYVIHAGDRTYPLEQKGRPFRFNGCLRTYCLCSRRTRPLCELLFHTPPVIPLREEALESKSQIMPPGFREVFRDILANRTEGIRPRRFPMGPGRQTSECVSNLLIARAVATITQPRLPGVPVGAGLPHRTTPSFSPSTEDANGYETQCPLPRTVARAS